MATTSPRFFRDLHDESRSGAATVASAATHVLLFALLAAGLVDWLTRHVEEPVGSGEAAKIAFGGSGASPAAPAIEDPGDLGSETPLPEPAESVEPAESPAPVPPRPPRPLSFDDVAVPTVPREWAPSIEPTEPSVDFSEAVSGRLGGVDPTPAGAPGRVNRDGFGARPSAAGQNVRGDYDSEPTVLYEPPPPDYPKEAREKMVAGEVILQVLVKVDGSTEVLGVIKSLPYCVEAAIENAKQWRWKPAMKDGRPVEAYGIITITFDIFSGTHGRD